MLTVLLLNLYLSLDRTQWLDQASTAENTWLNRSSSVVEYADADDSDADFCQIANYNHAVDVRH